MMAVAPLLKSDATAARTWWGSTSHLRYAMPSG